MSPQRHDLNAPSASGSAWFLSLGLQPTWPYGLGVFAGPVFGVSVLGVLAAANARSPSAETAALIAFCGALLALVLLGIAWLGVRRGGQCGKGPIAGSFALPFALAYLCLKAVYLGPGQVDQHTIAAVVVGSFAAFSWGHVATPCGAVVRVLAAVSATSWTFLFVAVFTEWDVPNEVMSFSLVMLSLIGLFLGLSFYRLQSASRYAADPVDADWD